MYKRQAYKKLQQWKSSANRKPLIIRGARQVGKTTLVHQFSSEFDQYLYFNLEKNEDQAIFKDRKSIKEVIDAMFFFREMVQKNMITLIFIDEIQALPEAIPLLRYFYEEYPEYYVIAAGSLLEVLFNSGFSFPVGRVEYMHLYPFTFEEFIVASGSDHALNVYNTFPPPDYSHNRLLELFHSYALIGGMPEAVLRYNSQPEIIALKPVFESLLIGYMDDIEKYAKNQSQANILRHAIPACFREAGSRIRFQGFGSSVYGSREMGEALRAIEKTRLITLIYPTIQVNFPFSADVKKSPRLQVIDTGLVNHFAGITKELFQVRDLTAVFQGRIIEHLVGQEIIATNESELHKPLFWVREKVGTTSELDFMFLYHGTGIPVEIKSGKTGTLRSLHQYIEMSKVKIAVRLYAGTFRIDSIKTIKGTPFTLLSIPYYHAGKLKDYLDLN
jgi:uncharacterized protein